MTSSKEERTDKKNCGRQEERYWGSLPVKPYKTGIIQEWEAGGGGDIKKDCSMLLNNLLLNSFTKLRIVETCTPN